MPNLKYINRANNVGQLRNYVFDKNTTPIIEIELGEEFIVETEDAFNGILRDDPNKLHPRDTKPYSDMVPRWGNPVCGPIYVKGVDAGDVLVVNIIKIDKILTGVTCMPNSHHFTNLRGWEECDEMYTGIIENVDGKSTFEYEQHKYMWKSNPFIGTIATAPQYEVLSSIPTSFGSDPACGGNMDCMDIKESTKVYLQSYNSGGLLFFGDVHASQGEGEVTGVANEVAAEVILSCDVIKKKHLNNVRLESDKSLISVYCYRPMEEAVKQALKDLILWLEEDYQMSKREAYILASICPEFRIRIYQYCTGNSRLMITAGAELDKKILP